MTSGGGSGKRSLASRLWRLCNRPGRLTVPIAAFALLGTAHVLIRTHPFGAAVVPDSVIYLSTALSVLDGEGLQNFRGKPLVLQPPLFPMILAFFGLLGLHPWEAARLLNAAAFGSIILLSGLWLGRNLRSPALAVAAAAALAAAVPLNDAAARVLTEPVFVLFVLLALTRLEAFLNGRGAWTTLLLAAAFTALAAVTRYMGVSLILAGALLLLAHRGPSAAERWKHAAVFGILSSLPLAAVWARNWMLVGEPAGDRRGTGQSLLDTLSQTADVLGGWLLPPLAPTWIAPIAVSVGVLSVLAVPAVLVASKRGPRAGRRPDVAGSPALPYAAFVLVYTAALILAAPLAVHAAIGNSRYFVPIYAPLVMTGAYILDRIASGAPRAGPAAAGRIPVCVFLAGILAHAALSGMHNLAFTDEVRESGVNGNNYNTAYWNDSEVLKYVRSHLDGRTVSNAQELVWIADGMSAAPGKHRRLPKPKEGLPGLMRWMRAGEGEIHLIFLAPRPALGRNPFDFNGLHLRLLPNVETVAELPDGVVLRAKLGGPVDEGDYLAARDGYVPELVAAAGEPVARAHWDLYLKDGRLSYVKPRCTPADVTARFFLRVSPGEGGGLPAARGPRASGDRDLDFEFHWFGLRAAGRCAAVVTLPRGPLAEAATGQYAPGGDPIWEARFPLGGRDAGALRSGSAPAAPPAAR